MTMLACHSTRGVEMKGRSRGCRAEHAIGVRGRAEDERSNEEAAQCGSGGCGGDDALAVTG
jgi:hypothetical protein